MTEINAAVDLRNSSSRDGFAGDFRRGEVRENLPWVNDPRAVTEQQNGKCRIQTVAALQLRDSSLLFAAS